MDDTTTPQTPTAPEEVTIVAHPAPRGRKRKPEILGMMSLTPGSGVLIHDHREYKTSFSGWLAISRQRFKKNFQGRKLDEEGMWELRVEEWDPNRKPRKKRTPKVAPVVAPEEQAIAQPATEPMTVEPVTVEPVTVEPVTMEPITVEPVTVEPITVEPVTVEPAVTPAPEG